MATPVQHQFDAFNDRDLGAFTGAYAPDTRVEDGAGNDLMSGAEEARAMAAYKGTGGQITFAWMFT